MGRIKNSLTMLVLAGSLTLGGCIKENHKGTIPSDLNPVSQPQLEYFKSYLIDEGRAWTAISEPAITSGDFNNDGKLDFITFDANKRIILYENIMDLEKPKAEKDYKK